MQKTKIVKIQDLDNVRYFKIRAMGVVEGLDMIDKIAGAAQDVMQGRKVSIKDFLPELIPLAAPMDAEGKKVTVPDYTLEDALNEFENPIALLQLATEVLEFQQGFLEGYEVFQKLTKKAKDLSATLNSASETKSEA
ncbi:MAG TPA: hypothetical protein DD624_07415 [Alphaproteobacteria bacterium]|nr:hypothetical protein [Alphaproteobacteria bacterium]